MFVFYFEILYVHIHTLQLVHYKYIIENISTHFLVINCNFLNTDRTLYIATLLTLKSRTRAVSSKTLLGFPQTSVVP